MNRYSLEFDSWPRVRTTGVVSSLAVADERKSPPTWTSQPPAAVWGELLSSSPSQHLSPGEFSAIPSIHSLLDHLTVILNLHSFHNPFPSRIHNYVLTTTNSTLFKMSFSKLSFSYSLNSKYSHSRWQWAHSCYHLCSWTFESFGLKSETSPQCVTNPSGKFYVLNRPSWSEFMNSLSMLFCQG